MEATTPNDMQLNKALLQTKGLAVGYVTKGVKKVLIEDVNVSLHSGELVCLLGQNGVGKSTLLRSLINLQKPLAGEVIIDQKPITQYSSQDLSKKIGLVLTDSIQAAALTVTELIALGRSPYTTWTGQLSEEDWQKVSWAIDNTRINYIADKYLFELSDGQLQKAMIAKALAQDGDLMIMDEPTAHLDLNNRVEIMNLLKDLTRTTGKGILVATHELQLTLQLADQLWLTNFNQPLLSGTPEDLALQGHLESTFYHENFDFDVRTGKVTLPTSSIKQVHLVGVDEQWLYWTKNALTRAGFSISEAASTVVTQTTNGKWHIATNAVALEVTSIEALLRAVD